MQDQVHPSARGARRARLRRRPAGFAAGSAHARDARRCAGRVRRAGHGGAGNSQHLRRTRGQHRHEHRSERHQRRRRPRSWDLRSPAFRRASCNAGTIHISDGVALQAKSDLTTAYNDAAGRSSTASDFLRPRRSHADVRGVHLRDLTRAQRRPHPRRPGRPERRIHLPGRIDPHHRLGKPRHADRRGAGLQRVLAGRQLGHDRNRQSVRREHPGPDVHLADDRRHAERQRARAQRRRHA